MFGPHAPSLQVICLVLICHDASSSSPPRSAKCLPARHLLRRPACAGLILCLLKLSCRLTDLFTLRTLQVSLLICRCDDAVRLLISACELRTLSSSAPPSNSCFLSCLSACCCRSLKECEQRRGLEGFFCRNSD